MKHARFTMTEDDLLARALFLKETQPTVPSPFATPWLWVVMPLTAIALIAVQAQDLAIIPRLLIIYVICVALLWVVPALRRLLGYRIISLSPAEVEHLREQWAEVKDSPAHRVELSAESITVCVNFRVTIVRWSGIRDIAETANHVFFLESPRSAIAVPRRAFLQPPEFDGFVEAARAFHAAALDPVETGIRVIKDR